MDEDKLDKKIERLEKREDRKMNRDTRKGAREYEFYKQARKEIGGLPKDVSYADYTETQIINPYKEGTKDYEDFAAKTLPIHDARMRASKEVSEKYKPQLAEIPQIDIDEAAKLKKQEQRRKWMNIPIALKQFNRTGNIDLSQTPSAIARQKRMDIYSPYKEAVEQNRNVRELWKAGEAKREIGILEDAYKTAIKDKRSPEEIEAINIELETARRRLENTRKQGQKTTKPTNKSRVKEALGENASKIAREYAVNELTKGGKPTVTDLNEAYDAIYASLKGEDGEISAEAAEEYIKNYTLNSQISAIERELKDIEMQMTTADEDKKLELIADFNKKAIELSQLTGEQYNPITQPKEAIGFFDFGKKIQKRKERKDSESAIDKLTGGK